MLGERGAGGWESWTGVGRNAWRGRVGELGGGMCRCHVPSGVLCQEPSVPTPSRGTVPGSQGGIKLHRMEIRLQAAHT